MNFTKITSVSDIRRTIKNIPATGGVYKQYVNKKGLLYLDGVYPTTKETMQSWTPVLISKY